MSMESLSQKVGPGVRILNVSFTRMSDLAFLRYLPSLEFLNVSDNQIEEMKCVT